MRLFFSTRSVVSGLLLVVMLSLTACGFKDPAPVKYEVSLEVWGVFDNADDYTKIIKEYKDINPNIKEITYRKLPIETYQDDLINAFAIGKGPDIFMVRNSWRGDFENKATPAPTSLITELEYRNRLVDVVADDFINAEKQIYGVPLSVDSLALYYNKDLLRIAGIVRPPETWDEVLTDVTQLNRIDAFGTFIRSGVALGTGSNINRSSDILMALMMQMQPDIFSRNEVGEVSLLSPEMEKAFNFYAQFAQIKSDYYSWNARQDYSIDAFYKGNVAMMFNYSWQYDTIKQKNAKLDFGVAPLPQFNSQIPINIANYWGFMVSKNLPDRGVAVVNPVEQNNLRTFEAWQFLKYLTLVGNDKKMNVMNALSGTSLEVPLTSDPTKMYLDAKRKPAARRDLVEVQKNDLILSPFAFGNLIAENWYQGDSDAADAILVDAIDSIGRGEMSWSVAFKVASERIKLLIR